jgi:hypothetical protein
MPARTNVRNPFNDELLPGQASAYVKKARKARAGARKALRSGNPARRAEAQKVYDEAPGLIRRVYLNNM